MPVAIQRAAIQKPLASEEFAGSYFPIDPRLRLEEPYTIHRECMISSCDIGVTVDLDLGDDFEIDMFEVGIKRYFECLLSSAYAYSNIRVERSTESELNGIF